MEGDEGGGGRTSEGEMASFPTAVTTPAAADLSLINKVTCPPLPVSGVKESRAKTEEGSVIPLLPLPTSLFHVVPPSLRPLSACPAHSFM